MFNRYSIEVLSNGYTRVFDRESLLSSLYYTNTGLYYTGDLPQANIKEFTQGQTMDTLQKFVCVNETEKFYDHFYLVSFDNHTGWDSAICVNANNEQDAIDEAADYAENMGWMGYFLERDDPYTIELEGFEEVDYVGNHGLPVNSSELNIKEIEEAQVTYKTA